MPASAPPIAAVMKFEVYLRQKKQRNDCRVFETRHEQIVLFEANELFNAGILCVRPCFFDALRIYVDTHTMRAVSLGSSDNDTSIAAAKIDTTSVFLTPASFSMA